MKEKQKHDFSGLTPEQVESEHASAHKEIDDVMDREAELRARKSRLRSRLSALEQEFERRASEIKAEHALELLLSLPWFITPHAVGDASSPLLLVARVPDHVFDGEYWTGVSPLNAGHVVRRANKALHGHGLTATLQSPYVKVHALQRGEGAERELELLRDAGFTWSNDRVSEEAAKHREWAESSLAGIKKWEDLGVVKI